MLCAIGVDSVVDIRYGGLVDARTRCMGFPGFRIRIMCVIHVIILYRRTDEVLMNALEPVCTNEIWSY